MAAGALVAAAVFLRHDPDTLWRIVDAGCVPNQRAHATPAPCVQVDLARGFAILKDRIGVAQLLLIPTRRVTGIEDPALLRPGAPNDWAPAWDATPRLSATLGRPLPRQAIALAINSAWGRTQDQLHIHIDCVRSDVAAALRLHRDSLAPAWQAFPVPLAGRAYRAMRVDGADLSGINPFRLLADGNPAAASAMGRHTLVVIGMVFAADRPGFVILDGQVDLWAMDLASGERLQDHDCAISR